ncbi:MAG: LD-carboxypeptidase [Kofleriaceae bacterium]
MILPPRIRPGDKVGIVAPAGPVKDRDLLARGIARLGGRFEIVLAGSLERDRDPELPSYLAASDDQRAEELDEMLGDPDIRAIVLARGGYGLMRILPRLDPDRLRRDPKPLVGFSDATALLAWAHAAGVRGIHGPMILQLAELPESDVERLVSSLTDPTPPGPRPWSLVCRGSGIVRGPLVPANLTVASMLVGTKWPVPLAGAVALFEEIGEKPYELDRYLTQLALTGVLGTISAMVVGDLTRCVDPKPPVGVDPPDAALRVIHERVASAGKPIAVGAPVGHGDRNEAVPFGAASELDLDRGVLAILEAAVS